MKIIKISCQMIYRLAGLFLITVLVGCTTTSTTKSAQETLPQAAPLAGEMVTAEMAQIWQYHQRQVAKIEQWQLSGRLGVNAGDEGGSASLFWEQDPHQYLIVLTGPLGQGGVELFATPSLIQLTTADGQQWVANDAATLLWQHTGWWLPVDSLYYWARGIPAPGDVEQLELNDNGLLTSLQQQGWQIEYRRYTFVGSALLPQRINLSHAGNQQHPAIALKLIVRQWQTDNAN